MHDTDILKNMMNDNAIILLEYEYDKPLVKLREIQTEDSEVEIRNLPNDAVVIKIDSLQFSNKVFKGSKGECKCADYIIISEKEKCILYIEIKKTKESSTIIKNQLLGAYCFLKYIQKIGRSFWKNNNFLDNYKHRFINFSHTNINSNKKTRIIKESKCHDTPENFMKIDWPNRIEFKKIACLVHK